MFIMDRVPTLQKMCFATLYTANGLSYKHEADELNVPDRASLSILKNMDVDLCCVQAYTRSKRIHINMEYFPSLQIEDLMKQSSFNTLQDRLLVTCCRTGRDLLSFWSQVPRYRVPPELKESSLDLSIRCVSNDNN